jgi:hypothetical protein
MNMILVHVHIQFNLLALLAICFTLYSCVAYSSAPKLEATCFSETSVDFQRTTRRYILEYITLHSHRSEKSNVKSDMFKCVVLATCVSIYFHPQRCMHSAHNGVSNKVR